MTTSAAPWQSPGRVVVVGTYGDSDDAGAVYIFRTTDGGAHVRRGGQADGIRRRRGDDRVSVAIDGDTVLVGAWGDAEGGSARARPRLPHEPHGGATYDQVAKLTARCRGERLR